MDKNNNHERKEGSDRNSTQMADVDTGEALGTVGGGAAGAIVGSMLGPIGTVAGGIIGAAVGNKAGEAAGDDSDTAHEHNKDH
ncbi:hypothetical protein [Paenibacillus sp. RC67]|uniref:hypothetical protein n=1 Tax=Paenibacillus sp. RC67 TaxID=3039392 RepID=UPI0024ADA114|nr:hypothetical protein [Paenibacillus sp. RC67]